jgi:hypothetical protein
MTPADALEKAAELVRAGWIQGDYYDDAETQFCAMGALSKACGERNLLEGVGIGSPLPLARAALVEQVGTALVTVWNDHPERTQDEVVEAMLQAAKILRNQEVPA